jgi:hypothetical protein
VARFGAVAGLGATRRVGLAGDFALAVRFHLAGCFALAARLGVPAAFGAIDRRVAAAETAAGFDFEGAPRRADRFSAFGGDGLGRDFSARTFGPMT